LFLGYNYNDYDNNSAHVCNIPGIGSQAKLKLLASWISILP